jgi:hypothetical protein
MTHRLFDAWTTRRHRQASPASHEHPTLWVALALVSALLGSAAALMRNADDEPKLALARSAPELVGSLLHVSAEGPAPAASAPQGPAH